MEATTTNDKLSISTTLGDLIYAIAEAAREACVDEADYNRLTQLALESILQRSKGAVLK